MNRFLFTLIILCISSSAMGHIEPPKTLKEKSEIHKKQQRLADLKIKEARLLNLDEDNKETLLVRWVYDSLGRETNMELFTKSDQPATLITQTYDRYGNLVLDVDCNSKGQMQEMNVLEYDEDGLIWNIISYDSLWAISGSLSYHPIPETNEIFVEKTNAQHLPQYTIAYRYEQGLETGLCTEIIQHDAEGRQMMRVENEYNTMLMRTHKHVFNEQDSLLFTYEYSYTAWGDFKEIIRRLPDGEIERTDRYSYDQNKLPVLITVSDAKNEIIIRRKYVYRH